MFGFLNGDAMHLASALVEAVDNYLTKFGDCTTEELARILSRELPDTHFAMTGDAAQVAPPELPAFQFLIGTTRAEEEYAVRPIAVFGRREYATFGLDAAGPRTDWFCYAGSDLVRASRKAKKLVRVLDAHYGIADADRFRG